MEMENTVENILQAAQIQGMDGATIYDAEGRPMQIVSIKAEGIQDAELGQQETQLTITTQVALKFFFLILVI